MAIGTSSRLINAMRHRSFVRFSRRFEDQAVRGYILDVGPRFFLVAVVSDRIWFDGFECLRIRDVKHLRPDPYAAFVKAALVKRGERAPRKPRVSVASVGRLLLSAGRVFPLVTICREQVDPDVCWIGRVCAVNRRRVSLLEINPDATWDGSPTEFRLNDITRVCFGGDYESALHLVARKRGTN